MQYSVQAQAQAQAPGRHTHTPTPSHPIPQFARRVRVPSTPTLHEHEQDAHKTTSLSSAIESNRCVGATCHHDPLHHYHPPYLPLIHSSYHLLPFPLPPVHLAVCSSITPLLSLPLTQTQEKNAAHAVPRAPDPALLVTPVSESASPC